MDGQQGGNDPEIEEVPSLNLDPQPLPVSPDAPTQNREKLLSGPTGVGAKDCDAQFDEGLERSKVRRKPGILSLP
jgi:hypothetical protein